MRIQHVMTKDPSCCLPSDSAQRAASIMRDEHAGIVPVIEDAQTRKIAGVVTDRDLCMNVVAAGLDPSVVTVEQCMTTKVVTCSPNDSVERVTELMRENQIRRVPVINEGRELQGIQEERGHENRHCHRRRDRDRASIHRHRGGSDGQRRTQGRGRQDRRPGDL